MDPQVEKWHEWCDGTIKNNVFTMYIQRDAWEEVSALLKENAENLPESYWWQFMFDTYAHTAAMAVRRQADTHPDAASLGRLISEIADHPGKLKRDEWSALNEGDPLTSEEDRYWRLVAEETWAENFGGEVETHLDPAIPRADLERLTEAAREDKDFVDRHVAHADSRAASATVTLTLNEVHDAVSVIGELFVKYFHQPWATPIRRPR